MGMKADTTSCCFCNMINQPRPKASEHKDPNASLASCSLGSCLGDAESGMRRLAMAGHESRQDQQGGICHVDV